MIKVLALATARALPAWFEREIWRPFLGGAVVLALIVALVALAWASASRYLRIEAFSWLGIGFQIAVAFGAIKFAFAVVDELAEARRSEDFLTGEDLYGR